MANPTGQLFYDPLPTPLNNGAVIPNGFYNFYVSGSTTPAPVYQDAGLTTPYPTQTFNGTPGLYIVTGNGQGQYGPIYLNPSTIYRQQLYNSSGALLEDNDPIVPALPVTGNGPLTLDAFGEVTVNAPQPGGTGVALTVNSAAGGMAALLTGSGAGNPALVANSTVTVGGQTATFAASNKPGTGTTAPTKWLPITCDGATYYLPLWQ
jgi:hypothetical protein